MPSPEIDQLRARIGRDLTGAAVSLGPLRIAELRELARRILPRFDEVEVDRVARRVAIDSAGIPLLAVELLRAVALGMDLAGDLRCLARAAQDTGPDPAGRSADRRGLGDQGRVRAAESRGARPCSRRRPYSRTACRWTCSPARPTFAGGADRGARRAGVAPVVGKRAARLRVHRADRSTGRRSRHAHAGAASPRSRASRPLTATARLRGCPAGRPARRGPRARADGADRRSGRSRSLRSAGSHPSLLPRSRPSRTNT